MIQFLCGRRGISITLIFSILFALMPIATRYGETFAASTEAARVAELIEGAKNEGKVSVYMATAVQTATALVEKFQEKYPFIKVELYRADNTNTLNRVLMETKAKKRVNDVIKTIGPMIQILKENGVMTKYLSPEREFYPEGFKDKDGYWTDQNITVYSVVYNTRLVPPKEIPVRYKDLLNPKWKGKMGINLNNFMWANVIMKVMGEHEGMEFLKALARQNLIVRNGGTLSVLLVAAGEISIALAVNANNVEDVKAQGAPVDWARLKEPLYGELHPIGLNAFAPHPNAAKLFIDFALSQEVAELFLSFRQIPSRLGMKSKILKVEDINPLPPTSSKETAYYRELVKKLFVK